MSNYLSRRTSLFNDNLSLPKAFTAYIKCNKSPNSSTERLSPNTLSLVLCQRCKKPSLMQLDLARIYRLCPSRPLSVLYTASGIVWGNPSNPVSLFFGEPVIGASIILLRLPDHSPEFKGLHAESCMIFVWSYQLQLCSSLMDRWAGLKILLRAGAHPNVTCCDALSIVLPRYRLQVAGKEMLQKAIPLTCSHASRKAFLRHS